MEIQELRRRGCGARGLIGAHAARAHGARGAGCTGSIIFFCTQMTVEPTIRYLPLLALLLAPRQEGTLAHIFLSKSGLLTPHQG
jgi:hypothetical protein